MTFSKTYLYKFIRWVACSFERCTDGSSARKWTAFAFVILAAFLHVIVARIFISGTIKETQSLIWILLGFLSIDCATILLLFQILTGHDIVELTHGLKDKKDEIKPTDSPTAV
jgi:hypothetical protein